MYKNQLIAFMEPFEKFQCVQSVHRARGNSDFYDSTLDVPRLPTAEPEHVTREKGKWETPEKLFEILGIDDMDISGCHKQQLRDLIAENSHCFSRDEWDLGKSSFYEAEINVHKFHTPKWVPSRDVPYGMRKHMNDVIDKLESSGQITSCKYSLWNSACFLVGKSTGSYRFVQDCRALNKETIQDHYELNNVNTILDGMTEANYLSSFDFTKSFVQIGLKTSSQPLTAFSYAGNRYQWTRLVMGAKNSSSQFSRCMALLFSKIPFNSLVFFIDDLLMGSKTADEHLKRLKWIFSRLSWGNLKLNPKKTNLFKREVTFLGQKLSREGLRIDDEKIKAVETLQPPTNVKQLQSFLGVVNYQRSYIKGFSIIASPLYKLLKKGEVFKFTSECMASFEALKKAIASSPVLALPDVSDPLQSFEVTVDSSKRGHGATLTQLVHGKRRVISYWSKAVPKHQQKFGPTKLEFLALYEALKAWRIYLQGTKFTVLTDCKALTNLDTIFSRGNAYMQRRLADLASFNFVIKHVSGKSASMSMPDFLSRYPYEVSSRSAGTQTECTNDPKFAKILRVLDNDKTIPVTLEDIRNEYPKDKILSEVIGWLKDDNKPANLSYHSNPAELCHYYRKYDFLELKNGILYRKYIDPNDDTRNSDVIVVPYTLTERVLYMYHDTVLNCHSGVEASLEKCRRKFYFYKMAFNFKLYVAACITCQRNKRPQAYLRAPLKSIHYSHFGQAIEIDHLEPMKKATPRGNVALLTIVDLYSSFLVVVPVRSLDTKHTIRAIIHNWVLIHGVPEVVQHDRGSSFTSELFQAVMKMFGIKDKRSTPYHSQTQGAVESQNFRINQAMRVSLQDHQWKDYDLWIGYIVFCLNSLVSKRTGYSANFLAFGRELYTPRDFYLKSDPRLEDFRSNIDDRDHKKVEAYELYKQVTDVTRRVHDNFKRRAQYSKKQYDKRVRGPFPKQGDFVFLLVDAPVHKYADRWVGPYKIEQKISDWNYVIIKDGVKKVVSISKLKLYKPNHYTPVMDALQDCNAQNSAVQPAANIPEPQKVVQPSSDDSSDEDWVISMPQPRRSKRNVTKEPKRSTTIEEGVIDVSEDSEHEVSDTGTQQPNLQVDDLIPTTGDQDQDVDAEAEQQNLSGMSDDFRDALEAQEDANRSREEENATNSRPNFDSVNDPNLTLTNIEQHQTDVGLSNPLSTSGLSRSATAPNLNRAGPSGTNLGTERPSTRYNLR
ncbi:MAG: DDE-type integrase/transposase/recombinase, partial [Cytophagales bacterium]|nr:DDE-type integrase/transposase/recombinase [Cytophagales bacterium]